jgi:hypothetical protein
VQRVEVIRGEAQAATVVLANNVWVHFGERRCDSRGEGSLVAASAGFQVFSAGQSFAVILGNFLLYEEVARRLLLH